MRARNAFLCTSRIESAHRHLRQNYRYRVDQILNERESHNRVHLSMISDERKKRQIVHLPDSLQIATSGHWMIMCLNETECHNRVHLTTTTNESRKRHIVHVWDHDIVSPLRQKNQYGVDRVVNRRECHNRVDLMTISNESRKSHVLHFSDSRHIATCDIRSTLYRWKDSIIF
jgi:hypothetical protein